MRTVRYKTASAAKRPLHLLLALAVAIGAMSLPAIHTAAGQAEPAEQALAAAAEGSAYGPDASAAYGLDASSSAAADGYYAAAESADLETAVASARELREDYYTDESWPGFASALSHAESVLGNADAEPGEAEAARAALDEAIGALVRASAPGYAPLEYSDVLISLGADESELMFTWYTAQETAKIAYREQGAAEFAEVDAANGASETGVTHKATISGLKANAVYEYALLGEGNTASKIFAVETGDPEAFRFIAVGDPQIGSSNTANDTAGWVNTLNRVSDAFPDASFLLSAGDQVERAGTVDQYTGYLKPQQLKTLPTSQTVGNHDTGSVLFTDHFNLPNSVKVGDRVTNIDYWYTYGGALFMHIDANVSSYAAHSAFLEGALAANPDADWNIVVFHQGPYTNASHDDNDGLGYRQNWAPKFNEFGIDVVLNGHDHSYTRAYQMLNDSPQYDQNWLDGNGDIVSDPTGKLYNAVLNPTGTAYIEMNSGSGSKFYGLKPEQYFVAKQVQTNTPNFSVVDIDSDSFTIETYALNARYDGAEHEMIDSYSIIKGDDVVPPAVDKSGLEAAIAGVQGLDEAGFTPDTWAAFAAALAAAQAVAADGNATQDDVDGAVAALSDAKENLAPLPDKTALNEAIAAAEGLKSADYSADSWNSLQRVLGIVKELAANPNANQAQVTASLFFLNNAVDALLPAPPYEGVVASIEAAAQSDALQPIEFTVSLEGAKNVSVVTLVVEADGNMLGANGFEALSGFSAMSEDIAWAYGGNGRFTGRLTLVHTPYGTDFTSAGKAEILRLGFTAKQLGETSVRLVDAIIVEGVTDGNVEWKFGSDVAKTNIVEGVAYSPYDLNKDFAVDEKDLSIILGYYLFDSEDPEWEYAKAGDFGGTEGRIDITDILAVYANFTL